MLLTDLSTMKLGFAGKRAFQDPLEGLMKNTFMANPSKKPGRWRARLRGTPAGGCYVRVCNVRPLISSFNKETPRWPWCLTVAWGSRAQHRSSAPRCYPAPLSSPYALLSMPCNNLEVCYQDQTPSQSQLVELVLLPHWSTCPDDSVVMARWGNNFSTRDVVATLRLWDRFVGKHWASLGTLEMLQFGPVW